MWMHRNDIAQLAQEVVVGFAAVRIVAIVVQDVNEYLSCAIPLGFADQVVDIVLLAVRVDLHVALKHMVRCSNHINHGHPVAVLLPDTVMLRDWQTH